MTKHQSSPTRRSVTRALAALHGSPGHTVSPLGSCRLSYADDNGDHGKRKAFLHSSPDKGVRGSPMKKKTDRVVAADRTSNAFLPRIGARDRVVAPPPKINRSATTDQSSAPSRVNNDPSPSSVLASTNRSVPTSDVATRPLVASVAKKTVSKIKSTRQKNRDGVHNNQVHEFARSVTFDKSEARADDATFDKWEGWFSRQLRVSFQRQQTKRGGREDGLGLGLRSADKFMKQRSHF